MKTLEELIAECDKLWDYDINVAFTFNYSLGKFPAGWQFSVNNNWCNWSAKKLTHTFGIYNKPEHAISAFLEYVKREGIDVKKLAERTSLKKYQKMLAR